MVKSQADSADAKQDQGNDKKRIDAFLIQIGDQAPDAIPLIIFPVPVVEQDT